MNGKIKLGISTCLLGKNVRYNGGNKLEPPVIDTLEQVFENLEFVPLCPEVEAGFPIPREPARLVGSPRSPRMVTQNTGTDVTDRILDWAKKRLDQLEKENLRGFVFKSRSPSCEMDDTDGFTGIFARAFMERFPHIPVIDEIKFRDETLRKRFIKNVKSCIMNSRRNHEHRTQENN